MSSTSHKAESSTLSLINSSGVVYVELNRPEVNNAFDDQLIKELIETFETLSHDDECLMAVLGSRGKHFSAGADLRWMKNMAQMDYEQNRQDALELARLMNTLYQFPKPLIGRVQGAAYGGALGLIACCDIVIAEDTAQFCLSEVKLGLSPAVISPFVLNAIGSRQGAYYFLTADRFDSETAKNIHLIHQICESGKLDAEVKQMTEKLLSNGPAALRASKRLIRKWSEDQFSESLTQFTAELIASLRVSEEGQEGMTAFFEKRPPAWQKR